MALYEWIPIIGPSIARQKVIREIPEFAKRHHLTFEESRERYNIGSVNGEIEGYSISINIHEMRMAANCSTRGLKLLSYDDYERRTNPYKFQIGKLNRFFKVPEIVPKLQTVIQKNSDFEESIAKLLSHYEVPGVHIWNNEVKLQMQRSGFDGATSGRRSYIPNHYITVQTLEKVLPDFMKTVKAIDQVCRVLAKDRR